MDCFNANTETNDVSADNESNICTVSWLLRVYQVAICYCKKDKLIDRSSTIVNENLAFD